MTGVQTCALPIFGVKVGIKAGAGKNVLISGKAPKELFGILWAKYPNKDSRSKSETSFVKSVVTDEDWQAINKALENYLNMLKIEAWKHPQSGKTWFNNWRDWIDYKREPKKKETVYDNFV